MRLTAWHVIITLIVVASVEWSYVAYLKELIDPQLAVTLIIVEVPSELGLAWLISKFLEQPEQMAKRFAQETQRLAAKIKTVDEARVSLRAHYIAMIRRMEQWKYTCKGIYTKPGSVVGLEQTIIPTNLQKDLAHLAQFRQTWELYDRGPDIDREASAGLQETRDLMKNYLENMMKAKAVSFINWNMDELVKQFTVELIHSIRTDLKQQTFRPIGTAPDMARPGFCRILAYEFQSKMSIAESFAEILNSIRQLSDVKKKVVEMDKAEDRAMQHTRSFILSLRNEVIEPAKNSDYTDERLSSGVCDDCRHLKDVIVRGLSD